MATNVAGPATKIPRIVSYSYKDFEVDVKTGQFYTVTLAVQ